MKIMVIACSSIFYDGSGGVDMWWIKLIVSLIFGD